RCARVASAAARACFGRDGLATLHRRFAATRAPRAVWQLLPADQPGVQRVRLADCLGLADVRDMLTFANPAPFWVIALALIAIIALAVRTYAGARDLLSRGRWLFLVGLRALALLLLGIFLLKPVIVLTQASRSDAVVPILIDNSRSMRLADVNGQR